MDHWESNGSVLRAQLECACCFDYVVYTVTPNIAARLALKAPLSPAADFQSHL